MATITKRSDNLGDASWQVKIRRKGFPSVSKTFDSKAQAEVWAHQIESEMSRGAFMDRTEAERNTLGDILKRYVEEVTPHKKGHEAERYRILALIDSQEICKFRMSSLSSKEIAAWRDNRLKDVSGSTVNREMNILGHAIETARREWGVALQQNPVSLVRRPKHSAPRERRLARGEEARLLVACQTARNPFLRPVVELALETAMRQSELARLEWSYVDLDKRSIHLLVTKNGDSRGVPLSTRAVGVIRNIPKSIDGRVFPGLSPEAIKRAFIRACARAGLNDFHFHDLRHEATSRMFEKGLNPLEVASITGHKTLQMLKRYTHLDAQNLAHKLG
jgi:integrase